MLQSSRFPVCVCLLAAPCVGLVVSGASAEDSASAKAIFANPSREFTSAPFWVWNDMLTEEEILLTLRQFESQGIKQVFVHPRPGLMTPYLSEDWFRMWRVAIKEANERDLNVWIYDENSYPSGFAGGFVPEAMPESRGVGLVFKHDKNADPINDTLLAVFRMDGDKYENVTQQAREGKALPEADYLVVRLKLADPSPWFGGKTYVDLLRKGVTEKFLEVTLEPYRKQFGDEFGKRIPGSFTDEPHLRGVGERHWTPDLPEAFEKRWGYSLLDNLPALTEPVGDWRKVRHNYNQVLLDLFIERWAKPYFDYCAKNNLEFTGHYWEHEWPNPTIGPDNQAMYAWQQRPAIDILFNQYDEGTHAQFGNVRACMELGSVANQMGLKRTLCEAYGGSGWDARFEDFKRIGDWMYALGVNTLNQHLSHMTLRGARKRDYPPVFSYHTPWWSEYHALEAYLTRLSVAITRGEQINPILLIEPTTTAWMYQGDKDNRMDEVGNQFQKLVTDMAKAQVEFDLGSEDIIARNGSAKDGKFVVGKRAYATVVIPPMMENMNGKTVELIEAFLKQGGTVFACDTAGPARIDGKESERGAILAKNPQWKHVAAPDVPTTLLAQPNGGFLITRKADDKSTLYHQRRQLSDGDLLFLVNTSNEFATAGTIKSAAKSVQEWNLETGAVTPYVWQTSQDGVAVDFSLAPCGSLLLFLSKNTGEAATQVRAAEPKPVAAKGPIQAHLVHPNVLTIDYLDVSAGGETKKAVHYSNAAQFAFEKNGMGRNPWDHAVQFRDEFIKKTFPPESGFEVTYRFVIDGTVPKPLYFVVERPDLYTITCNGKKVAQEKGDWWLDRAFGKIDITKAAKKGENEVAIKASPFTVFHEIEAAYVIGEFSLKAVDKGFAIVPAQELKLGPWNEQGYALYGDAVAYAAEYDVASPAGRYVVSLPKWYGSVAKVIVNGKPAGVIYHQPWECDVTEQVVKGENIIEVTVFGTLKNTLGPHYGNPPLGFASPGSFNKGPETGPPAGSEYSTIAYGLFEPFALSQR